MTPRFCRLQLSVKKIWTGKFMIPSADVQLVKRCLEAYYENCSQVLPNVPDDMKRGTWQQDDWVDWKMIPSRLTETDVEILEAKLPFRLPPLFRAFLVTYFVLDMDFGQFCLPALPSDDPLKHVKLYLLQTNLWRIGYAQFASGDCGDPVCFDLEAPTVEGDYPVVIINHDWIVPYENWQYRDRVEPHAKHVARSFREFFTRLCLGEPVE
jgi:hypothetical protein